MNLVEVKNPSRIEPYDITEIEQMHELEALGGISIRGLSAEVECKGSKRIRYDVTIMGEVQVIPAGGIERAPDIYATCYDSNGQVCGSGLLACLSNGMRGGVALNKEFECKSPPVKLRIFPKLF